MGSKPSKPSTKPFIDQLQIPNLNFIFELPKKKDDRYGGDIYIDYSDQMAYRVLQAPKQQLNEIKHAKYQNKDLNKPNKFNIVKFLNNRIQLQRTQPRLITLKNYQITKEKNGILCSGNMQSLILQFPYPVGNKISKDKNLTTLQDKIRQYCKIKKPIPEAEVRQIFYNVVSILFSLQQNKTCHGDIKPKSIILTENRKDHPRKYPYQIELVDSFMTNIGKTSYEIVLENPESLSLLSPELLDRLNPTNNNGKQKLPNRQEQFYAKTHQTQIFAVGLTMLETMTAENAMQCYDLENLKIKDGYFTNKGQEMRKYGYSDALIQIVYECLGVRVQKMMEQKQVGHVIENHYVNRMILLDEDKRIDFQNFLRKIRQGPFPIHCS